MKITSAKFIKGIAGTEDILYDGKFHVAFLGRSNVGKSTLINSLTSRNNLARSSATPGKTIRMDFFLINNAWYFVDFPGYGYAKRSQDQQEKLRKMILWYLMYSGVTNRLIVLILDAKVGITPYDQEVLEIFREHNIDHIIVANKIDNLQRNEKEKQLKQIQQDSGNPEIISYSSKLAYGRNELMGRISERITKIK